MAKSVGETSPLLIEGGDLVLPDRLLRKGSVLLAGGKVRAMGPADRVRADLPPGCRRTNARGLLVCPSLWEIHIHGCGGLSMENMTPAALAGMAGFLAGKGVGAFLPTTVADEKILAPLGAALESVSAQGNSELDGRVLGIYVEGPFVSPARKGGIPPETLREPSVDSLREVARTAKGRLRVMTFAPELPGASELLDTINSLGILPSLGHSDAALKDLEPYENVISLGVTHLFNGMSGVSHKDPGLAHWALLNPGVYTELNCDGTHVQDAGIQLALRARPWQRIVLISDAFTPAGLAEEDIRDLTVYGRRVTVRGGGVYYEDSGVLVGSRRLVNEGVGRLVSTFGVPLPWAVAMASLNAARHLGFLQKGALLPGYDADVAIFSPDIATCFFLAWQGRTLHRAATLEETQA